jgi:hypothetical protein
MRKAAIIVFVTVLLALAASAKYKHNDYPLTGVPQRVAQSSVGTHVANGDFDDLFQAAPACKQVAVLVTTDDKFDPTLEKCTQEVKSGIQRVEKAVKKLDDKKDEALEAPKLLGIVAGRLIQAQHQLLLEAMQRDMLEKCNADPK